MQVVGILGIAGMAGDAASVHTGYSPTIRVSAAAMVAAKVQGLNTCVLRTLGASRSGTLWR